MPIEQSSPRPLDITKSVYHTGALESKSSRNRVPSQEISSQPGVAHATTRLAHSQTCHNLNRGTPPSTSKSSNSLEQELFENHELIERLFPKCRPKSKPMSSSEHKHSVRQPTHTSTMRGGKDNSMAKPAGTKVTRRLWSFMDISPSSSPPLIHSPTETFHHTYEEHSIEPELGSSKSNITPAHYRLDSLLSSSEARNPGRLVSSSNGIKKANRFQLDSNALDDSDDYVLFSRFNNNKHKNQDNFGPDERQTLQAVQERVHKVEQNRLETLEDEGDDEINGDSNWISPQLSNASLRSIENRNRIEMAGGKEIISSSRGIRAKRRTTTSSSNVGKNVHQQEHKASLPQLYSVSMVTMPSMEHSHTHKDHHANTDTHENKSETLTPTDSGFPSSAATTTSNLSSATADKTITDKIDHCTHKTTTNLLDSPTSQSQLATHHSTQRSHSPSYANTSKHAEHTEHHDGGQELDRTRPESTATATTSMASIDIDFTESLIREIDQVLEKPNLSDILKFEKVTGVKFNNDELAAGKFDGNKDNKQVTLGLSDEMNNLLQSKLEAISKAEQASNETRASQEETNDENDEEDIDEKPSSASPEEEEEQQQQQQQQQQQRLIGSVAIAQYEGSPKRYGPKPGYPRRVLASSSTYSTTEELDQDDNKRSSTLASAKPETITNKKQMFSPENGSPHSTTSSSSGTFSSTEIHSSTSSCLSNAKLNGFGNWNLKSRIADHFDGDPVFTPKPETSPPGDDDHSAKSSQVEAYLPEICEPPTVQDSKTCTRPRTTSKSSNEPIYSTLTFDQSPQSSDPSGARYPGGGKLMHYYCDLDGARHQSASSATTTPSVAANRTALTFPVDRPILSRRMSNGCLPERPQPLGCNNQKKNTPASRPLSSGNAVRESQIVPKPSSQSHFSASQHNVTPQSLDRSEANENHRSGTVRNTKPNRATDYSYSPSDDEYDRHLENGNLHHLHPTAHLPQHRNELEPQQAKPSNLDRYPAELGKETSKLNDYESSPGHKSSDISTESCSSEVVKSNGTAANTTTAERRMSTMPVLEDGLSSGMPSSDEMEYEDDELDDEEGDDEEDDDEMVMAHDGKARDLDDYVKEYNSQQDKGRALNLMNGEHYYHEQLKPGGAHKQVINSSSGSEASQYRCLGAQSGDHHHPSHHQHLHNHPMAHQFEPNKHLSGSDGGAPDGYTSADKYCYSSQLRAANSNGSATSSHKSPSGHGHHHYHHYYHHHHGAAGGGQTTNGANHVATATTPAYRPNYPNLATSPTSPDSPGGASAPGGAGTTTGGGHFHSSSMSSSSSTTLHKPVPSNSENITPGGGGDAVGGNNVRHHHDDDCDTDQETDRLLAAQRPSEERSYYEEKTPGKRNNNPREARHDPKVLIEGVLFRARYLGSTQLVCDGQPTKATRMMQAEEAVSRIKAPEGETQPSTEVDLFISTEKIMVLNTDLKQEIMMDHALRTISYIADIGDLLVLMARRRTPLDEGGENGGGSSGGATNTSATNNGNNMKRLPKMICHVFESEEAQYIAQSIGQAFQVAYMEFLKANGIEDSSFLKEMDYQEVLNSQEIFGNELEMFAKREKQKEVIVPKQKNEILGIVIVESGWGSMLPTVVIANMAQNSPSARCGQLNIGDQIIAINGISLVGLPLSTCQAYVKNTKNQTAVKFTIVPCAPVVEVKIKRPDTKYQLGFSVQNGVICSLLRGGIAERGGVRVGHRIIEINGQSVVAVPHDRIVNLLATSVGEILMKTMPTSMFRLLTGQETPNYM